MTALLELIETLPATLPFGVDLVLRATIILAIVAVVAHLARHRSAATRHLVVTLGLAAVVALPVFMLTLPDARLEVLPVEPGTASDLSAAADSNAQGSWKTGDYAMVTSSTEVAAVARAITATGAANEKALTAATFVLWVGDNWKSFFLVGLTLIPVVLLGRLLIGMLAVWIVARRAEDADEPWMQRELGHASRRLGVKGPIRMLLSDRINVPLVWGVITPVLILPTSARNWTRERFRVVILHEVAHVRRFDVLSLMTGRLATALYWFHPLSWVLERTGRRECERACDDLVIQNGARASDYADHLLGIATGEDLAESYASVTLAMARPSELEGRLVSILRAERERAPVSRRAATIAAALAFVMLLPIASVRLTARTLDLPPVDVHIASIDVDSGSDFVAEYDVDATLDVHTTVDAHATSDDAEIAHAILAQIAEKDTQIHIESDTELVKHRTKKEFGSEGERWYSKAYELHGCDRYDEAIEAFKKAIEHDFKVGTSMYNIACGFSMQGDATNAIRWLEDAFRNGFDDMKLVEKDSDLDPIRSDPRFRGLLRDLRAEHGTTVRKDRFDEARQRYDALRASNSEKAGHWSDVGTDLLRLRELDDAIYSLERAIALRPDAAALPLYNLACAYALKGDTNRALDTLEKSILEGFDGGTKMLNDPDLASIRGDKRFTAIRTMSEDLSLWIGFKQRKASGEKGKWNEDAAFLKELPRFESVVAKYPDAGRAWFNLGYAALRAGSLERARDGFERSLALDHKRATSMYNLACVEARAGNSDAAMMWLHQSEEAGGSLGEMHHDDDLDNLRGDPRFEELLEKTLQRYHEQREKMEQKRAQEKEEQKHAGWI